jgi:hypothetical protein
MEELAKVPMANESEGVINPVINNWRKVAEYARTKRYVDRWRCFFVTALSFVIRPGESSCLKALLNVDAREHGKPDCPCKIFNGSIPPVREGEGPAGRGSQRKQRSWCNATDRTQKPHDARSSMACD